MLSDILIELAHKDINKLRELVYDGNLHYEIEGMRKFIESRQDWCKDKITNDLSAYKQENSGYDRPIHK